MFLSVLLPASLTLVATLATQELPSRSGPFSGAPSVDMFLVLEGLVLSPDGLPAAGAMVVTSAGGRATTDLDGRYRIALEVPATAEEVQVSAFCAGDGSTMAAHGSIQAQASGGITHVDALSLASSARLPRWLPTFGGRTGTDAEVRAFAVFDDGRGPALYAGGDFVHAGGVLVNHVARWDGHAWSALGSGMSWEGSPQPTVWSLAVFDDGSGPALYVGGVFTSAGGVPANFVARWDGASWSALGAGLEIIVTSLAVFDDGSGPALFAGGRFWSSGRNRIAKWNGTSWQALGAGLTGPDPLVFALEVFDDGTGPALYAGGQFTTAGTVAASNIARWDGASWSALGNGVGNANQPVYALTVHDEGSGPALFVGGRFTTAGGAPAGGIARWDGATWSTLENGVDYPFGAEVRSLRVFDEGNGPALFVGGKFDRAGNRDANGIARWKNSTWTKLDDGVDAWVDALAVFDDGRGAALYAGGYFPKADGIGVANLGRWKGGSWSALLQRKKARLDGAVRALTVHDDGRGSALFAGGVFLKAGGVSARRIARWDGESWSALGSGMDGEVRALASFDDGSGPALFAGGFFATAGGVPAVSLAKWDGSSWSAIADLLPNSEIQALQVHDDGSGPALYVGGLLEPVGHPRAFIARWNGSTWSTVGSGTNGFVNALAVFDDGSGPALFAGGWFTLPGSCIAKWNGASWSPLGSGLRENVYAPPSIDALAVFDDGTGPQLYVGGTFGGAGGITVSNLARWDGSSWSATGSGADRRVGAFTVFDDGSGAALYAGGSFRVMDGLAASRIARWNGSSWSTPGSGISASVPDFHGTAVSTLAVFDDGHGPELFAGGRFESAPDSKDSYLARHGVAHPGSKSGRTSPR